MENLPYNKDTNEFQVEGEYTIDGKKLQYYAIHHYYSKSKFSDVDQNIEDVRKQIWNFKDGYNSTIIADKIAHATRAKELELNNSCLVIIPASTNVKTTNRFEQFCTRLSSNLGIANAYKAITTKDHEPMKGQSGVDKIIHFSFNPSYYKDKTVYLLDDICTSGTSFKQVAQKLLETGANKVIGLFLGKTVSNYSGHDYTYEFNIEDFID